MTFFGSLGTAVMGINAQAAAIGHISDNVANASTNGYRQVSTYFSDLVTNKLTGDSPIIGSGTYANNRSVAVSATGTGEFFIRGTVAHDISALVEYKGMTVDDAAREVIFEKLVALNGDGGVIAMDRHGNISMPFNTLGMYRASIDTSGEVNILLYDETAEAE